VLGVLAERVASWDAVVRGGTLPTGVFDHYLHIALPDRQRLRSWGGAAHGAR
jgi:hypothetical protein